MKQMECPRSFKRQFESMPVTDVVDVWSMGRDGPQVEHLYINDL